MSNENQETIEDIVAEMRNEGHTGEASCLEWIRTKMTYYADRIEDAHKREIADEKRISNAVIQSLRDRKLEMAGEIAAKDAEIAELRECLREAVREQCPFTRMSCRYGEQCDYECGTEKWRAALAKAAGESEVKDGE